MKYYYIIMLHITYNYIYIINHVLDFQLLHTYICMYIAPP